MTRSEKQERAHGKAGGSVGAPGRTAPGLPKSGGHAGIVTFYSTTAGEDAGFLEPVACSPETSRRDCRRRRDPWRRLCVFLPGAAQDAPWAENAPPAVSARVDLGTTAGKKIRDNCLPETSPSCLPGTFYEMSRSFGFLRFDHDDYSSRSGEYRFMRASTCSSLLPVISMEQPFKTE